MTTSRSSTLLWVAAALTTTQNQFYVFIYEFLKVVNLHFFVEFLKRRYLRLVKMVGKNEAGISNCGESKGLKMIPP